MAPHQARSEIFWAFLPPQNAYKSPVMVIYKKKFLTLCYISRPNGLQNKISSFQAQFWKNQARSQVLGFGGKNTSLGGKIFVFIVCLKQVFLRTTKFGVAKKILGELAPNAPMSAGLGRNIARKSSIGRLHVCGGARHSENLYLIHNMNSICTLCK